MMNGTERNSDGERWLNHAACPLDRRQDHSAQVIHQGAVMATLYGPDAEALKARAHRLANGQGWQHAMVVMS